MSWTADGAEFDYDIFVIVTLVEYDGELKVAHYRDFSYPEKWSKLLGWVVRA